MKKLLTILLTLAIAGGSVAPVAAETLEQEAPPLPDHIVISSLQTSQTGAAGNDFMEWYNPTPTAVDVTGWKLQYRSAAATGASGWTTKRTVACVANAPADPACRVVLLPRGSLLFATYTLEGLQEQPVASGFSNVGGQLRIMPSESEQPVDMLGYGTAAEAEGAQPAAAPAIDRVLLRKNTEGTIIDTNNNANDFATGCYQPVPQGEVTPGSAPTFIECPAAPAPNEDDQPSPDTDGGTAGTEPDGQDPEEAPGQGAGSITYPTLLITELLPDPASPQADSTDEFIELFNPTAEPVDATDYRLESGADFRYHFVLADITIPAGGYAAITSADSHLSLTNSGTAVRLLDPAGRVIDMVENYGAAKSGQSWAKSDSGWQWTTSPTAGLANAITAPVVAAKKAATSKAVAKPATTKVAKAATAAASKASKTAAAAPVSTQGNEPPSNTLNYFILGGIGVLALAYVVYEYRQDIAKLWRKLWSRKAAKSLKEPDPTLQTD